MNAIKEKIFNEKQLNFYFDKIHSICSRPQKIKAIKSRKLKLALKLMAIDNCVAFVFINDLKTRSDAPNVVWHFKQSLSLVNKKQQQKKTHVTKDYI